MEKMRIEIIDNFLDPFEIHKFIKQFSDVSRMRWNPYEHDVYKDMRIRVGMTAELDDEQREILDERVLSLAPKLKIDRTYVNAFRPDDTPLPHTDSSHTTALIYCNLDYDIAYGGETFFYENDEVSEVVSPRPGRIVLFDGDIQHAPRPFNRLYDRDFRYTIVYKLGVNDG